MQKPSGSDPRSLLTDGVQAVLQARTTAHGQGPSGSRNAAAAASHGTSEAAVNEMLATNPHIHEPHGSYEQSLRSLVQSRTQTDSDFNAERFPNIAKWISGNDNGTTK